MMTYSEPSRRSWTLGVFRQVASPPEGFGVSSTGKGITTCYTFLFPFLNTTVMAEIQLSEQVRSALDRIDWSALEVPRSVVEANPKVAEQLAAGKSTDLITYSVQIPGIPEPIQKTVQLVSRRMKDEATGEWVLDPRVGVREMNEDYHLSKDNLKVVFDNGFAYKLDPEKDRGIINSLLETRTVTNKETGEQHRQYVCNICPEPLVITYKDGREQKFFLGFDSRSHRPVAISEGALKARFVDEEGHSRISHELFGKGIKVDDQMAQALGSGQISAAFGKGTKTGEPFGTAISFNVARGEIAEDHSAKGQEIRAAAYDFLKKKAGEENKSSKKEEASEKKVPSKKATTKRAPKL